MVPNKDEYDRAVDAVQRGVATQRQKDLAARQAKQAGSRGNDARAALEGKKKW